MAKTSKAWAMLHAKCPRCRRGDMFEGNMYSIRFNKIKLDCPYCKLHFEIEPGYFYAAMYVSYALNIAEACALVTATYVFTHNTTSPWLYTIVLIGGCFLLSPITFRYSRVILLYWLSPKIHYHEYLDTDDQTANT